MREGNTGSDAEGPGAENGGLPEERELAEDLERSLLEDVVGESSADEMGDVTAQRRIGITEKLFQCSSVAVLREKDQESLVGRWVLLRWSSGLHT